MGQTIQVEATQVGDVAIFDTDRSITGQDGTGYASAEEAAGDRRFPGRLALRLFEADDRVDNVWVASNQVVIRRTEPWNEETAEIASDVIRHFFRHYPD